MTNSPESVARAFVRAINRQDVDGLTALMALDHRFVDSLGNAVEGREKMRSGWTGYFRMFPDYTVTIDETYCDGPVAVLLGVAHGTYAPNGDLKPENHWEITLAIRAFVEDGLVTEWRVYADNEPVRQIIKSAS
jgi:ketosteroid isomerase-like protein